MVWRRYEKFAINVNIEDDAYAELPRKLGVVRGNGRLIFTITKMAPSVTQVEFVTRLDIGLDVPKTLMEYYTVYQLRRVTGIMTYFQKLRRLEELDSKDGMLMGEVFVTKIKKEKNRPKGESAEEARVNELYKEYRALEELDKIHHPFKDLMIATLRNKIRRAPDLKVRLDNLSSMEGQVIGGGLALALITNTAPESAVDEWIHRYPSLIEFDTSFEFFRPPNRPMMNVVGKRIQAASHTGVKYRTFSGAGLNLMDGASDIYMTVQYYQGGDYGFAKGVITTVLVNLFVQLLIVYIQNKKIGVKKLLLEAGTTVIMLKPAIDAARVASGAEQVKNQLMDVETEMALSRCAEIVAESIPSGIMQAYAFLLAKEKSKAAAASIVISAMTISFAAVVLSWDVYTSPKKRKTAPDFYGYIKNDPNSRLLTFLAMLFVTCSHVLMKIIATVLVISVSGVWLAIYMGGDVLLFLLVKVIRGDFRYWLNVSDPAGIIFSFVERLFVKTILDFTCVFHTRHPYEVGGILFMGTVMQNQVGCFVAAKLYIEYYDGEVDNKLEENGLWAGLIGLCCLFVVSSLSFFGLINKDYLHTFFGTMTGPKFAVELYHSFTTDMHRVTSFDQHPTYYGGMKEELKELLEENWEDWMQDRPEWLTDRVIADIPDEFLPVKVTKTLERVVRKNNSLR